MVSDDCMVLWKLNVVILCWMILVDDSMESHSTQQYRRFNRNRRQNTVATSGVRWRQDSEPVAVAPTKTESGEEETSLWLAARVVGNP